MSQFTVRRYDDLLADYADASAAELRRGRWGSWRLDREQLVLEYERDGVWIYEVDLERCRSSPQVLDWICQVASKSWASLEDVGQLVRALDFILHPQANLCSCGTDKRIDDLRTFLAHRLDLEEAEGGDA